MPKATASTTTAQTQVQDPQDAQDDLTDNLGVQIEPDAESQVLEAELVTDKTSLAKHGGFPEPASVGRKLVPARPASGLSDPVALFLKEARKYPRLSAEEEKQLSEDFRENGNRNAAKKLVVHNLRLVVSLSYQYRRAWTNMLDLFQEGSVGLMEAVKRWEPNMGTRFGSYAAYWIRARMCCVSL